MTELDNVWSQMLGDAARKAGETGRHHVAEYLRLKATNDAIRERGVSWLFDTFVEIAVNATRKFKSMTIERESPHRFVRGSSNMVGSALRVRLGVRCLTVEAGWARTPSDGFMQKGALAFARVTHFGMPKQNAEWPLVHAEAFPNWLGENGEIIHSGEIRRHFDIFLGA